MLFITFTIVCDPLRYNRWVLFEKTLFTRYEMLQISSILNCRHIFGSMSNKSRSKMPKSGNFEACWSEIMKKLSAFNPLSMYSWIVLLKWIVAQSNWMIIAAIGRLMADQTVQGTFPDYHIIRCLSIDYFLGGGIVCSRCLISNTHSGNAFMTYKQSPIKPTKQFLFLRHWGVFQPRQEV